MDREQIEFEEVESFQDQRLGSLVDIVDLFGFVLVAFSTTVTIVSYPVSQNMLLKLTHFGNFIRDDAALGQITWNLLYGSVRVPYYNGITVLNGDEGWPRYVKSPSLVFRGGNTLTIQATNNSIDTDFFAGGRFKGELHKTF